MVSPTGVACEARAGLHLHLLRAREVAGRDDSMARHFLARDLVDLGVDLIGLIGQVDALHLEERYVAPICLQRRVEGEDDMVAVEREHFPLEEKVK